VAVLRSTGEPGKASPIRGGGRTEKRTRRREPGEDCRCLVERLTEGLGGERSVWGADRSQGGMQLAIADADVACSGEQLMEQGSPLVIDTGVVRS
jgi:hypothetical protein